jgi:hypothetical protein
MTDRRDRAPVLTRRRLLTATGAAVTATIAGCQGDGATADGSTTSTPAPLGFPAGTSDSGIDDPEALVEATQTALANADYETTSRLVQPDPTVEQSRRSSLDDKRQLQTFETETEDNEIFVADGTAYIRSERDGEITYSVSEIQGSFNDRHRRPQLGGAESLGGILGQGSYTPAETRRHNGRRVRQFTLDSASLPDSEQRVTDAEGSVLVDADSAVHEAVLELELETGTGSESIDRTFSVSALGPLDVPEPDWVDTARQQQN